MAVENKENVTGEEIIKKTTAPRKTTRKKTMSTSNKETEVVKANKNETVKVTKKGETKKTTSKNKLNMNSESEVKNQKTKNTTKSNTKQNTTDINKSTTSKKKSSIEKETKKEENSEVVKENNNETKVKDKSKTNKTKRKTIDDKEKNKPDMQEIQKTVRQELKDRRTIIKQEQKKMNREVFNNLLIAIAVVIFLNFIILGFINIQQSIFIVDLKVFAVILLAVATCIFEYAYKKDSGKLAIYGIEVLVLSIYMLGLIYIDIMLNSKFVIIAILSTYLFAIYYTIKSIVIYQKMKKRYFINSIKKIIKK